MDGDRARPLNFVGGKGGIDSPRDARREQGNKYLGLKESTRKIEQLRRGQ
jgi:hypothetical protein